MSPNYLFIVFIALCAFTHVLGDLYMQNPRGNNDRLNEDTDRDNANRLFDSQNNAQGGYCWGPAMTFVAGSMLPIEWTSQHSCGVDNTACNVVIQYMCSNSAPGADPNQIIRDGTTTTTIPTTNSNAVGANGQYTYGMNEPLSNYQQAIARARNSQLFTADQNVANNQGSMATRQNPTGTRYGFEATEENDYYPYWHPSPWKDIAVLTNQADLDQCAFYQSQSQNVMEKYDCIAPNVANLAASSVPNNEAACVAKGYAWTATPAFGIPAPDCLAAPVSRDNHLGNGVGAQTLSYNWTLPASSDVEECLTEGQNCSCVLRMRYNITLGELDGTEDVSDNGKNSPVTGNPTLSTIDDVNLTMAIDTAQTGRTFQDRSFMFLLATRPANIPAAANIVNINVRGKRGNIVQTYPATEYDFTPSPVHVAQGDYINPQWTGCDTNPAGNAGQGTDQTDRSNMVQIASASQNKPATNASAPQLFKNKALRVAAATALQDASKCLSAAALAKAGNAATNAQNCQLLNAAPAHVNLGLVQMNDAGDYYYMSTRNNDFSNRSQKASIHVFVPKSVQAWQAAVIAVAVVVAVAIGALVGTVVYAKRNPHSRAADVISKIPGLNKI